MGEHVFLDGKFVVEVVSSTDDYVDLMKEVFDFPALKSFLTGAKRKNPFPIIVDCMSGGRSSGVEIKDRQIDRQMDGLTDRRTDRWTGRHIDTQTHK